MFIHTDTDLYRLNGFSLTFILVVFLINNNSIINSKMINDILPNYIGSIDLIGPVILVNVYMLSVQVMKYMIKLLPLLG